MRYQSFTHPGAANSLPRAGSEKQLLRERAGRAKYGTSQFVACVGAAPNRTLPPLLLPAVSMGCTARLWPKDGEWIKSERIRRADAGKLVTDQPHPVD